MADVTEQRYEATFDVGERAELTLRNVRGDIEISGWDRPQVSVVAIKKLGTEWGAHESFEETNVEMEQDGPRVRVHTHRREWGSIFSLIGIGRMPPQVDYTITVPVTSDVSIRTVEGKLTISNVTGSVYARTVSGAIHLERVSGQVITNCVNGSVHGIEISGTLAAKSVSGRITVTQSKLSSLWSKTVDGTVSLETTIDPTGTYEATSVSGSLHLFVPAQSRISAEFSGISGRATCDLPAKINQSGGPGRTHWQAIINGGGANVLLKTVSGDLTIGVSERLAAAEVATPPVPAAPPSSDQDWPEMSILKAVERGELSVEQAIARLSELDKA